jgi:hypothetical protein
MRFKVYSLRTALFLLTCCGILFAIFSGYLRFHREAFVRDELLPAVRKFGFVVASDGAMMRVDARSLTISQLDLHSAVAIVGIGERYRIEIEGCKVTSEALNAFNHFERKLLGVNLRNCEVTAEKPTGLFVNEYSKDVGSSSANFNFGKIGGP